MLTIYCGDDTGSSRRAFSVKRESYIVENFQHDDISLGTLEDVQTALQSGDSLFQDKKVIFLENCFSKKPIRDCINKRPNTDVDIIAWEEKVSDRDLKRYFPKAHIYASLLPSTIWQFLDGLYPGNVKALLKLHAALQDSVEEPLLFFLLRQRIKDLILCLNKLPSKTKRASWQESKLVSQAKRWDAKILMQFHKKLGDIEIGTKTGALPYSVKNALDILFCFYVQ